MDGMNASLEEKKMLIALVHSSLRDLMSSDVDVVRNAMELFVTSDDDLSDEQIAINKDQVQALSEKELFDQALFTASIIVNEAEGGSLEGLTTDYFVSPKEKSQVKKLKGNRGDKYVVLVDLSAQGGPEFMRINTGYNSSVARQAVCFFWK